MAIKELVNRGIPEPLAQFFAANYEFEDFDAVADVLRHFIDTTAGDYPKLYFPSKKGKFKSKLTFPANLNKYINKNFSGVNLPPGMVAGVTDTRAPHDVYVQRQLPGRHAAMTFPHELAHVGMSQSGALPPNLDFASLPREPSRLNSAYRFRPSEAAPSLFAADVLSPRGERIWDDPYFGQLFESERDKTRYMRSMFAHTPRMEASPGKPPAFIEWLYTLGRMIE